MKAKKLDLNVEDVLRRLKAGDLTIGEAKRKLSALNIKQISDLARLDAHRVHRIGVPEVVLADGKSPEAVARSAATMAEESGYVLVTRITKEHLKKLRTLSSRNFKLDYNERARTIVVTRKGHVFPKVGRVGLLAAGTADIPVAEEAAVAAEVMGCEVIKAFDVGIAGIHRLFDPLKKMMNKEVSAIVAVAGMEGALPSVVASLVDVPVIGVPTSVGYGVGIEGLGALMTMLQSCTPKLAVVNIDNGFGAGILAALIARQSNPGKVG